MSTIPTDDSSSLQPDIVFLRPKADRRQVKDRRRTARGGRRALDVPAQLDSSVAFSLEKDSGDSLEP
jgi:hypothetical protein